MKANAERGWGDEKGQPGTSKTVCGCWRSKYIDTHYSNGQKRTDARGRGRLFRAELGFPLPKFTCWSRNAWYVRLWRWGLKMCVLSRFRLSGTQWTTALQVRTLEWAAIALSVINAYVGLNSDGESRHFSIMPLFINYLWSCLLCARNCFKSFINTDSGSYGVYLKKNWTCMYKNWFRKKRKSIGSKIQEKGKQCVDNWPFILLYSPSTEPLLSWVPCCLTWSISVRKIIHA